MSFHSSRNPHPISSNFPSSSSSRAPPPDESDTLQTWIYPTNQEVRQYQRSICETALFNNTLVCLPTGLGKTFIASVVMFNYYRWFPEGKIVFMAPTRPLVMQQIEACYRVVGIPESDTAHLEGSVAPERRALLWEKHRVFFCTPQVFANDVAAGRCDAARVVFVCFDEAHKATNNFAYTQAIKEISNFNDNFRVLALTATPGADARRIQSVIRNLNITKIESRSEDDPEVISHTHAKQIEIVKCKLGSEFAISSIKTQLIDLVKPSCIGLLKHNFLVSDVFENLNFLILDEAYRKFTANEQSMSREQNQVILKHFNLIREILVARKILVESGPFKCLEVVTNCFLSPEALQNELVVQMTATKQFSRLHTLLGRFCRDSEYASTISPKLDKLIGILTEHFDRHGRVGSTTCVIVFVNTRSTVIDIVSQIHGLGHIRAHQFVGQAVSESGNGLSQKEQTKIISMFRSGQYNVLVATCIAEEGLDIGSVDLIVCFDSVASPIRLIQRFGRVGRSRAGKVVVLVGEGKEEAKIVQSDESSKKIEKLLRNPGQFKFYSLNPKVLPTWAHPQVLEQRISITTFDYGSIGGRTQNRIIEEDDGDFNTESSSGRPNSKARPISNFLTLSQCWGRNSTFVSSTNEKNSVVGDDTNEKDVFRGYDLPSNLLEYDDNLPLTTVEEKAHGGGGGVIVEDKVVQDNINRTATIPIDLVSRYYTKFCSQSYLDLKNRVKILLSADPNSKLESSHDKIEVLTSENLSIMEKALAFKPSEVLMKRCILSLAKFQDDIRNEEKYVFDNICDDSDYKDCESFIIHDDAFSESSSSSESKSLPEVNESFRIEVTFDSDDDVSSIADDDIVNNKSSSTVRILDSTSTSNIDGEIDLVVLENGKVLRNGDNPFDSSKNESFSYNGERNMLSFDNFHDDEMFFVEQRKIQSSESVRSAHFQDFKPSFDVNDDFSCCACASTAVDDDNAMIQCEGECQEWVHVACYGLRSIPEGAFICEACELPEAHKTCVICKKSDGLMKKSVCGKLVHPCCVLFTNELTVDDDMRVNNLDEIDSERVNLMCIICKKSNGYCSQCATDRCVVSVHPRCALTSDFQMTVSQNHEYGILEYRLYCFTHFSRYSSENLVSCRALTDLPSWKKQHSDQDVLIQDTPQTEKVRRKRLQRSFKPIRLKRKNSIEDDNFSSPDEAESVVPTKKSAIDEKNIRLGKRMAKQMIDFEAILSGSDSGDETNVESDTEVLSGNFINDSAYTQHSDQSEEGFYHRVYRELEETPDEGPLKFQFRGAEKGLPLVERMFNIEKNAEKRKRERSNVHKNTSNTNKLDLGIGAMISKKNKRAELSIDEDELITTPVSLQTNSKNDDIASDNADNHKRENGGIVCINHEPPSVTKNKTLFTPDSFFSEDDW